MLSNIKSNGAGLKSEFLKKKRILTVILPKNENDTYKFIHHNDKNDFDGQ